MKLLRMNMDMSDKKIGEKLPLNQSVMDEIQKFEFNLGV